jgi:hypothetical protein
VKHETAVWAASAAFFGNLIALKLVDSYTPIKVLGSVGVSACVGATVYCKQRLDDAKKKNGDSD